MVYYLLHVFTVALRGGVELLFLLQKEVTEYEDEVWDNYWSVKRQMMDHKGVSEWCDMVL